MEKVIKVTSSTLENVDAAVAEINQQFDVASTTLLLLFFSTSYNKEALAKAVQQHFSSIMVIGCSTSGEIGLEGYNQHSITAIAFSSNDFQISAALYPHIKQLQLTQWHNKTIELYESHLSHFDIENKKEIFSLLLIDGLSRCEESFVRVVSKAMRGGPMIGGSAGDDLQFKQTYIFYNGEMHVDCGVLLLISTKLPFTIFKSQHVHATDKKVVVTGALPEQRVITELNGFPAAEEYARMLGFTEPAQLTDAVIAKNPVLVIIGNNEYVRSIQSVNKDGSITFYCAIDLGIVLRIAKGRDLYTSLENSINDIEHKIGDIQTMITFDCILRRLELLENDQLAEVGALLSKYNAGGFNTYGEQIDGLHMNQTCTGIAIGYADE